MLLCFTGTGLKGVSSERDCEDEHFSETAHQCACVCVVDVGVKLVDNPWTRNVTHHSLSCRAWRRHYHVYLSYD